VDEAHDLESLGDVYRETDEVLSGWSCSLSLDCCHFARTGREPYLWPNEWALLRRAFAARGLGKRRLAVLPHGPSGREADGACPLLSREGRCTVYADRPFGCRTYFCDKGLGPTRRPPRQELAELGRRIAMLARRVEPHEGPRALTALLATRARR
jgi:Fe-S-cluster containining protein